MATRGTFFCCVVLAFVLPAAADTVHYTYDDAGRLTLVDYGNGKTIAYTYDQAGNLLSRVVTDSNSSGIATKRQDSDTQKRADPVAKSHARSSRLQVNEDNPTKLAERSGSVTTSTGDVVAYLTGVTSAAEESHVTSTKNAAGKAVSFAYDKAASITAMTDLLNGAVQFTRVKNGLITHAMTPAGENLRLTRGAGARRLRAKGRLSKPQPEICPWAGNLALEHQTEPTVAKGAR